jgi:hypothetical protein
MPDGVEDIRPRIGVSEATQHRRRVHFIARKLASQELETPEFRVRIPKEGAILETLTYGEAEEMLVKADGNYTTLMTYLAHSKSARAFFKRMTEMKEKLLAGDPQIVKDAKNKEQREFMVASDAEYALFMQDLRTAEGAVAYIEDLAAAAYETLQVVKKIRDAALARHERDQGYGRGRGSQDSSS